ncbi:MAG: hypothetical protein IPK59_15945 [Rhodospirillaceae bacterium]|nr:hypothetical protein [Rhodospirillaceae bacterium]
MSVLAFVPRQIGLLLLGLVASASLAACDTPPARQRFPEITFQHLAPIRLDVARIEILSGYRSAEHPDDNAADYPEAPETLVADWARERLQAAGERGQATYTVVEARAVRVPLPRSSGISAALKTEQSDRYDLAITVRLDAGNPISGKSGTVTETVTRSQTVPENMTLNQREAMLFNLLDAAMKDLNQRLEKSIPQYLAPLIR